MSRRWSISITGLLELNFPSGPSGVLANVEQDGVIRICKTFGVEYTSSYGAGLLRYLQKEGIELLEVTSPDRMERRKREKCDTIDAEYAPHAAFSGIGIVTPKTRNGMIESSWILKICLKRP